MVIYSDCDYINDTDECVSENNTRAVQLEPLSNFLRLQTKGRALS